MTFLAGGIGAMIYAAVFSLVVWPWIGHIVLTNAPMFTPAGAAIYILWCGVLGMLQTFGKSQ